MELKNPFPYIYIEKRYPDIEKLLGSMLLSPGGRKGRVGGGKYSPKTRNVNVHSFSSPAFSRWLESYIFQILNSESEISKEIHNTISNIISSFPEKKQLDLFPKNINPDFNPKLYSKCFQLKPTAPYGFFSYFGPEGHYKYHTDDGHISGDSYVISYPERHISVVYYLNDTFEEGYLRLRYNNTEYRIDPKPGHILLFPSSKEFPHKVEPVISGLRCCVVNWFSILPIE